MQNANPALFYYLNTSCELHKIHFKLLITQDVDVAQIKADYRSDQTIGSIQIRFSQKSVQLYDISVGNIGFFCTVSTL